ncbi:MAG: M28 family peptidase [Candidatus Latescibacteria bacterium]|nr:M28 family peptidase [Candidatus Latescibacterota bacterium]
MLKKSMYVILTFVFALGNWDVGNAAELDELLPVICHEISGNRARDYAMRVWQYDKWSTLPMWKKSSEEIRDIMLELNFDEAEVVDTPADGRSWTGTWVNPLGWDVKQATLEVIEPKGLPEEFRYLSNYLDNPTSLGCWSAPTPPEGIDTELVLLERSNEAELKKVNAAGKIVLVSSGSRSLKKYLDTYGVIGIVSDEIEGHSKDSVTANNWQNGWTDLPGGWLMTDSDSKNNIRFSISQRKANYLRDLLRQGRKVIVRAKIDARYYTDDTLPYTTGYIRGAGSESEEVLIGGHNHEWGASDNAAGVGTILESVGSLNELIRSGVLPRPQRGIRVCIGSEIYGALAYSEHNLERLNKKTVAYLNCDDGGGNYDLLSSILQLVMNPNCMPSYTDALLIEIAQRYYEEYQPRRVFKIHPYSNADNLFCDPAIGVPSNWIYMSNINDLHHNSKDTIDKVDPRSLRDISILNALFLYYLADADYKEITFLADLANARGMQLLVEKYAEMKKRLNGVDDGVALGSVLHDGTKTLKYYTDLQKKTIFSIEKIVSENRKREAHDYLFEYADKLDELGQVLTEQFRDAVKEYAEVESIKVVKYKETQSDWEKESATIIPKRNYIGVYSLQGIPVDEWVEVRSDPHWWSATTWASSSLWWCDGKRNLNEIKELCEFEAGTPIRNFDLINYYRFLEKFDYVEFVR